MAKYEQLSYLYQDRTGTSHKRGSIFETDDPLDKMFPNGFREYHGTEEGIPLPKTAGEIDPLPIPPIATEVASEPSATALQFNDFTEQFPLAEENGFGVFGHKGYLHVISEEALADKPLEDPKDSRIVLRCRRGQFDLKFEQLLEK